MKRLLSLLIVQLFVFTSCDFLKETPDSIINSATFYKTENDAVAATNALYAYLTVGNEYLFDRKFGGVFFNDYWVLKEILSDNAKETIILQEYRTLDNFSFPEASTSCTGQNFCYRGRDCRYSHPRGRKGYPLS